jgi:hypothetical protein
MRSLFWLRAAGVTLALFAASFISFPSLTHGMSATRGMSAPQSQSVNRALKGDRLRSISPAVFPHQLGSRSLLSTHGRIPIGCDRAFSAVSSPKLARVFGRCLA